jgi:hypothetical protein
MSKMIPSAWLDFPAPLAARFGVQAGKQRTMEHEGHLVLVLHEPPTAADIERRATIFWRQPSGTWKSVGAVKGGFGGLKDIVEAYFQRAAALEGQIERGQTARDFFTILQEVAPLLRAARSAHRVLQEARDALPADAALIALRDRAYEAERTAELALADAKAGMDFTVARRAEEQAELQDRIARSSHRLNLITALFLPVTALSGIFGANLSHGFESTGAPFVFWGFVAVAFLLGFAVRASVSRT